MHVVTLRNLSPQPRVLSLQLRQPLSRLHPLTQLLEGTSGVAVLTLQGAHGLTRPVKLSLEVLQLELFTVELTSQLLR